jgi:SPP1 family predicted phage head-tail adaptor
VEFATAWASIEPLNGREFFAAQQVNAEVTARIRLRYLPGVTRQMQVKFGSRTFAIESVINVEERNRELQLMVKEVV